MLTVHVCIGSACHLKGAYTVINGLQAMIDQKNVADKVTVKAAFCLGECTKAVSVRVEEGPVHSVNENNMQAFFDEIVLVAL